MDKRSKKTRNKCLCWAVCLCIVAAAVIIGILAAVGVIGNQGAHPVQEVSARHFSNGVTEPPVKAAGGIFGLPRDFDNEYDMTTLKPTPGPPISTVSSLLPMTEMSMIQVPRALESQFVIDNLQFTPELNDTNSAEFRQLAQSLETELKNSLFDNNLLKYGAADIDVKVIDFEPGSVVVHYRIVWKFKDGIHNAQDPITADMAKRKLRSLLAKNNNLLGDYSVSEKSVIAGPVLDSCRIDNYGCEFNCSFNYQLADFICICPQHKILATDRKTCIDHDDDSNLPDFQFDHTVNPQPEPEVTNPPEEMFGVHQDYHETILQPTSEPTSEPEPTKHEDNQQFSQPEPEPTSKPEPEPQPTIRTDVEMNTQPISVSHENYIHMQDVTSSSPEPSAEPEPEPNTEPIAEPTSEPAPEPTSKPIPEHTAAEVMTESIAEKPSKSVKYIILPADDVVTTTTPTPEPAAEPTAEPAAEPTPEPAAEPTAEPAAEPTAEPAAEPTAQPAAEPAAEPTAEPAAEPTAQPAAEPAAEPTAEPAAEPTAEPAAEPTAEPAAEPAAETSAEPAAEPTVKSITEASVEAANESLLVPAIEPVITDSTDNNITKSTDHNVFITSIPVETSTESSIEPTARSVTESPVTQRVAEPTAEPVTETTVIPSGEPIASNIVKATENGSVVSVSNESTIELMNKTVDETTIMPLVEPVAVNTEKSKEHDSVNIVSVPSEISVESTTIFASETTLPPSNETIAENISKLLENDVHSENLATEINVDPSVEPTTETSMKLSENSIVTTPESITEHMNVGQKIPETATIIETTQNSSTEEMEASQSFKTSQAEDNEIKTETPIGSTMETITESSSESQEDSENHISGILGQTTNEPNPETTTIHEHVPVTEQTKPETTMKHEDETQTETITAPETESPILSVIPLTETIITTTSEQSPRQSKLSDMNPDEMETTTLTDSIEKIEEDFKTTTSEEPQPEVNSIVVSVNEDKLNLNAMKSETPQLLSISVNNATETVNLQGPKIYEITTPISENVKNSNEIHTIIDNSNEFDHQNSNMSHLNIIQESTENNSVNDNMSPFLPEIDNDTFVNKLHLGEHFFEVHTEETPPPRLDNDEKNETNPLDVTHRINETDNVINNTESFDNSEKIDTTTVKLHDKLDKSTLPPEIINNVHSNQFFENLKEIKSIEELKNNSGVDSSTEDLLALETTTNHENTTQINNVTAIHAQVLHTVTETVDVITENAENVQSATKSYQVKEAINDITTTERIFLTKPLPATTEIQLITNSKNEDLSVIPLEDAENDISLEEHSVLDKFSKQFDFVTTTMEAITEISGKCLNDQFLCVNGTTKDGSYCISMKNRCDSIQDCSDGSDEWECQGNCHENFQCTNGQCLKRYLVCDGIQHCSDGSDEMGCNQWNCTAEEFPCGDQQRCIPPQWRCDGRKQCPNGIDEYNCNKTCLPTEYHCEDEGICIPNSWRCDGRSDCFNAEDEQSCNCEANQFRCKLGGGCIDSKQRCDGVEDCPDRSDEWNCIRLQDKIVEIEIGNNTWTPVCSDNWNQSYSDQICNNFGYSSSLITENLNSGNFSNYLKLKSEQIYNVSILKQLETSDSCANIVGITCQEFSCGPNHQTVDDQQARIIGGSRSTETQWPSLSLLYNRKSNIECTATILTPIWVIASYSCVNNNGENWVLYAGNTNFFNNPDNSTTQLVAVERIIEHPHVKFSQFEYINDIVLIKLKKPLILTRNVSAVCLPENDIVTRQLCVIAGWGISQPGEINNQYLHYLPVPVIDNNECNSTKYYNGLITDDKICAGFTDSTKTPCYNDEGAPLMCFSDNTSKWELQGVLSYHDNCGSGNHPAIYTTINRNIKEWIINTIGLNPMKRA